MLLVPKNLKDIKKKETVDMSQLCVFSFQKRVILLLVCSSLICSFKLFLFYASAVDSSANRRPCNCTVSRVRRLVSNTYILFTCLLLPVLNSLWPRWPPPCLYFRFETCPLTLLVFLCHLLLACFICSLVELIVH